MQKIFTYINSFENWVIDLYGMKWANSITGKIIRIPVFILMIAILPIIIVYAVTGWAVKGLYRLIVEDWSTV